MYVRGKRYRIHVRVSSVLGVDPGDATTTNDPARLKDWSGPCGCDSRCVTVLIVENKLCDPGVHTPVL